MKICGACGLEFDRTCFSNKQWQLPRQKRRCKECVSKGAGTSETQADRGAGDREEPQPPPQLADGDACAGKSSKGQTDGDDEICGICFGSIVVRAQLL